MKTILLTKIYYAKIDRTIFIVLNLLLFAMFFSCSPADEGRGLNLDILNNEGDFFLDAMAYREILSVNGFDVSNPEWETEDANELFGYLSANHPVLIDINLDEVEASDKYRIISINLNSAIIEASFDSEIKIQNIPPEIGYLKKLRFLSLGFNEIEYLPSEFGLLKNLEDLDLSNNNLKELPKTFGELENLEILDLWDNELTFLPDSFGNLDKSKRINLSENQLNTLPVDFGLDSIQVLFINRNLIEVLPSTMVQMKELIELHAQENDIESIPPIFGEMSKLEYLDFSSNRLSKLPDFEIYGPFFLPPSQNLRILSFGSSRNTFSTVPSNYYYDRLNAGKLSVLSLYSPNLICLPLEVWNLSSQHDITLGYGNLDYRDTDCSE